MELKIKDIANLLNVSEKTIYRWLKSGKIPAYKLNGQYRFDKNEIDRWILQKKLNKGFKGVKKVNLITLLNNGGIFTINAHNIENVIVEMVNSIILPEYLKKDILISKLLERENLISTSIGNGIAVPHPSENLIRSSEDEAIYLFLNKVPIDYHALDEKKVDVFFLILTTKENHLEILSKISFLDKNNEFRNLLSKKISSEEIIDYISERKKQWDKVMNKKF